ncbi:MAG TPA: 4Fe-4S dicluster domain-containing protein [Candidatus Hydrogenedentes bacterium]|nr:4Fe-4S dicluster domain-containing protein [Candidatus Hydrogenedentota bacterium]
MSKIILDASSCTKCGRCVAECPAAIFVQRERGAVPEVDHAEFCIACGHCGAICPADAVAHSGYPEGTVRHRDRTIEPSADSLEALLRARRSVRAFQQKPVERQHIERIIEAARLAPTAHNAQDVSYIVVQDEATRREIARLTFVYFAMLSKQLHSPIKRRIFRMLAGPVVDNAVAMLPELGVFLDVIEGGREMILHDAPCLLFFHGPRHAGFADANANLALQNATLMAEALGLGSFYLGFVITTCARDRRIPRLLDVPAGHAVHAGMALGYPQFRYEKWLDRKPAKVAWR